MFALLSVYQLMQAKQIQIAIGHDDYDDLVRKLYGIHQDDEFKFHTGEWKDEDNGYFPRYSADFDWIQDENTRTIAKNASSMLWDILEDVEERVRQRFTDAEYDSECFQELWESAMYEEWSLMFNGTAD